MTITQSSDSVSHALGVKRTAATAGVTAASIFILCWIGQFIPVASPTHAYVGLFSAADPKSLTALIEGTLWSFLFVTLSGALFAVLYNRFAQLDRRT